MTVLFVALHATLYVASAYMFQQLVTDRKFLAVLYGSSLLTKTVMLFRSLSR